MNINISPRILREAQRQSVIISNKMTLAYQMRRLHSWDDIEKIFQIQVPELFKFQLFSYSTFSLFRDSWKNTTQARLTASTTVVNEEKPKIFIDKQITRFGNLTLYPEQQGVFNALRDAYFGPENTVNAALQDGRMGSGKTYVGAAILAYQISILKILEKDFNSFRLHPFIIFCPKKLIEHWKRVLYVAGLAEYVDNRKILVFSKGEFRTSFGETFCHEVEDPITGEIKLIWEPALMPLFVVIDECQDYIRPGSFRTKAIHTLFEASNSPKALFMSATPGEKVNDLLTLIVAIKNFVFNGTRINKENFSFFAHVVDSHPEKPNREGMKRSRKVLSPYIFSFPYVKPRFKAVNLVWLVEFESDRDKQVYASAHERYREVCEKVGKNTTWGQFEKFIALNNFRKTVEPLRANQIAERVANNYKAGLLATGVGTAYLETIAAVAFRLVDYYQIPREQISIIWGGKRKYAQDRLYSRAELDDLIHQGIHAMADPKVLSRVKLTLRYIQDQTEHSETAEEQLYRHQKLEHLKLLGKQSEEVQQLQIDNFQDGSARICLFTIASGGVGLSLDKDKPSLLPREGLFTPIYNGKEFQQGLGRFVRRASLADANQYIVLTRGTVEQYHVLPKLDPKLKCIAEITNSTLDMTDLLALAAIEEEKFIARDLEQAKTDAENDDTIVTDFHGKDDDDEDDDEPIESAEELFKAL